MRVVSLIASSTEMICALGFEDRLVGRSHECDFPPSVRRLPVCTGPRIPTAGSSTEIDASVKSVLRNGLSVYLVDEERLRSLRPDIIVTQTHCEVCAVSLRDVELAVCSWVDSRPRLVSLHPDSLADVWDDMRRVAAALGSPEGGETLAARLQARLKAVAERAALIETKPRVASIEWIDPLMAGGNWMPELIDLAGGKNLFGVAGGHSPSVAWEDIAAADPDVILVLPCGWDIARARAGMPLLTSRPQWPSLRAVRGNRVYLLDGNQYFNRPGPRLAESLEILAEVLHPGLFPPRFRGSGWQIL